MFSYFFEFFLFRTGLFFYLLLASKKWQWVSKVKGNNVKIEKLAYLPTSFLKIGERPSFHFKVIMSLFLQEF